MALPWHYQEKSSTAPLTLEALRGDATLAELASRHRVHATQIAAWRKQLLEHAVEVFDNGNPEGLACIIHERSGKNPYSAVV
jgi:hypothetical protein